MVYFMEHPKMDDARVPRWIFSTSIWINHLMIGLLSIQIWGDNVDRTDDGISWDYENHYIFILLHSYPHFSINISPIFVYLIWVPIK